MSFSHPLLQNIDLDSLSSSSSTLSRSGSCAYCWCWGRLARQDREVTSQTLLTGDIQHPLFESKSLPFITSNFKVSNLASFLQLLPRFYKTNVRSEFAAYATRPRIRARWDALQTEYSCCGGFNSGTGT